MQAGGITALQCRMARAGLDWSQKDLAERSDVARATLTNFESGDAVPQRNNLSRIRGEFEKAGARFVTSEDGRESGVFFPDRDASDETA